ncbi:MAG: Fic family protein [Methanomassiliicoccaceae archaeon]|nr:Fic family protein [Methanomassiliicoccaceae archaeon]
MGSAKDGKIVRRIYVTVEDLMEMHRYAIDEGPEDEASLRDSVRDEAALFFIVEGANNIRDHFERAAFLMHRIATRHPFYEGNKRTAFLAADSMLRTYTGMRMKGPTTETNEFIRRMAAEITEEEKILPWLRTITELIR